MSGMPKTPGGITGSQARDQFTKSLLDELNTGKLGTGGSPSFSEAQQGRNRTGGVPMMSALNAFDPAQTAARGGAFTGGGISGNQGAQVRGGLLGNLSNPDQPPSMMNNFTDKLLAGINNPLFQLGASLQNRRQSFTDNLGDFRKNMMQQQLFQKQLSDSEFDKLYKQGLLDINTLTAQAALAKAGIGKRKSIMLMDPEGNKMMAMFDDKGQYLTPDGQPIPAEKLATMTQVKEPSMQFITGKSQAEMDHEKRMQFAKARIEADNKFIDEDLFPSLRSTQNYRNKVANIIDIINAGGMKDKGGGLFQLKQSFAKSLGIESDAAQIDDVANAFRTRYAPELRVPGSGATTDYEMKMYLSAFPSLAMLSGGRDTLMRVADVFAKRATYIQKEVEKMISNEDIAGVRSRSQELARIAEEKFPLALTDLNKLRAQVRPEDEEQFRLDTGYGTSGLQGSYSFNQ